MHMHLVVFMGRLALDLLHLGLQNNNETVARKYLNISSQSILTVLQNIRIVCRLFSKLRKINY